MGKYNVKLKLNKLVDFGQIEADSVEDAKKKAKVIFQSGNKDLQMTQTTLGEEWQATELVEEKKEEVKEETVEIPIVTSTTPEEKSEEKPIEEAPKAEEGKLPNMEKRPEDQIQDITEEKKEEVKEDFTVNVDAGNKEIQVTSTDGGTQVTTVDKEGEEKEPEVTIDKKESEIASKVEEAPKEGEVEVKKESAEEVKKDEETLESKVEEKEPKQSGVDITKKAKGITATNRVGKKPSSRVNRLKDGRLPDMEKRPEDQIQDITESEKTEILYRTVVSMFNEKISNLPTDKVQKLVGMTSPRMDLQNGKIMLYCAQDNGYAYGYLESCREVSLENAIILIERLGMDVIEACSGGRFKYAYEIMKEFKNKKR